MATYTSKPVEVNRPAEELAAKFADFRVLENSLAELPAEERAKVGDVSFTEDTINILTPQVGEIRLRAVERSNEQVVFKAEGTPVSMELKVAFRPLSENLTEVVGSIEVDIPMMLKPLIGPTLQKTVDQFSNFFARLA